MDVAHAQTFLAVVATGSFRNAAERLNLTQTAVSARIRTLETQLGRRFFIRNKAGAKLTPAGERFVRHATALVQVWEGARQQVGLPTGREDVISLGGELSLWKPLLADWMIWMHRHQPGIALRTMVDMPSRLIERVQAGTLDAAVLYSPRRQPSLIVELLADEKLVMVTSSPDGRYHADSYIRVDWGPDFAASQQAAFPELANAAISVSLGPLALTYLLAIGGSGYFRLGAVRRSLEAGRLFRVPNAPEFSHSIYLVHAQRMTAALEAMREGIKACLQSPGD